MYSQITFVYDSNKEYTEMIVYKEDIPIFKRLVNPGAAYRLRQILEEIESVNFKGD